MSIENMIKERTAEHPSRVEETSEEKSEVTTYIILSYNDIHGYRQGRTLISEHGKNKVILPNERDIYFDKETKTFELKDMAKYGLEEGERVDHYISYIGNGGLMGVGKIHCTRQYDKAMSFVKSEEGIKLLPCSCIREKTIKIISEESGLGHLLGDPISCSGKRDLGYIVTSLLAEKEIDSDLLGLRYSIYRPEEKGE